MKPSSDRSLAQRLSLGFGSIVLVLLATLLVVNREQQHGDAATTRLERHVLPRTHLAWMLERSVLLVGIELRGLLLDTQGGGREPLDVRIEDARRTLQRLATMPKDPDGAALFATIEPATLHYLTVADSIARARPEFTGDVERALVTARDRAIVPVQQYTLLQQKKADTTIRIVAAVREQVSRTVLGAMVLCLLSALVAASLTTRSVRAAADRLLQIAQRFEQGDWRAVLALRKPAGEVREPRARDELARVAAAFQTAGEAIEHREHELTTRTHVAVASASSLDAVAIGRAVLPLIAEHANAAVGVIHLSGNDGVYNALAMHGLSQAEPLVAGDGVPGRALAEGQTVVIEDIPADAPFQVRLGFESVPVRAVASVPLKIGGRSIGVLTLGTLRNFSPETLRFLDAIVLQVAVGLQNARTFTEVESLLEEVSRQRAAILEQNEHLQAQAEELQAQFEEIQAQSEEIQAQNEELQAQTEEIQAQNSELLETTQQLITVDEQKNRFIALLGHELRNPLAAIANGVQLLSSVPNVDEMMGRTRSMLERQTRQLTRLVDDLLDVTRFTQGKMQLDCALVNFGTLVGDCVADHLARLDRQSVSLQLVVPEQPVLVNGDRVRLSQMVDNLIENAIKFTPAGGSISVSLAREGDFAALLVRDTGCGIERTLLPRLFQPFVQAEGPMQRAQSGLGLGLSLVRAHAELHGGSVAIESEGPGTGTTAILMLPISHERTAPFALAGTEALPVSPVRRVLIVEDNADTAAALADLLRMEGHHVTVTSSAPVALETARRLQPEIILCDLGLPGMDGFAFAREARNDALLANAMLVALTGYAGDDDRERVLAAGFDEHLTKPATLDTLRELARRAPVRRPPVAGVANRASTGDESLN